MKCDEVGKISCFVTLLVALLFAVTQFETVALYLLTGNIKAIKPTAIHHPCVYRTMVNVGGLVRESLNICPFLLFAFFSYA
jgi:hypothetical protein